MGKVNRMRWPHRGILTEMAKLLDKDVANIKKALDRENPNPEYAALYDRILRERTAKVESYKKSSVKKTWGRGRK